MLRSNLLGSRVALGFSATLHAALLFASTGSKRHVAPGDRRTAQHRRLDRSCAPSRAGGRRAGPDASPRRRESARASTPQHGSLAPPRDVSRPGGGKSTPGAASRANRPAGVGREVPRIERRPPTIPDRDWRDQPLGQPLVSPTSVAPTYDSGAPVPEQAVDGRARLVRGLAPAYPDSARADGVEGDVRLELVVDVSGAVESARVVRGVGHGLDESALRVARQFRFAPATKGGHPVSVRMAWSVQFRLQ